MQMRVSGWGKRDGGGAEVCVCVLRCNCTNASEGWRGVCVCVRVCVCAVQMSGWGRDGGWMAQCVNG